MVNFDEIKSNPQLDIVGIVAILGEGSTARNAQALALGWHHVLPRLLPAPQALLKHEHERRLPTVPGTVVGAYSGNVKFELNFFCQLLHDDSLKNNQVELVEVRHRSEAKRATPYTKIKSWFRTREQSNTENSKDETENEADLDFFKDGEQAYDVKKAGTLALLSVLGFSMSITMFYLTWHYHDGPAFLANLFLSLTSSIVGFASWWRLDFKEDPPKARSQKERTKAIPDSDIVIFYPRQGAFRIVRCSEMISRLYFRTEKCEYVCNDTWYRVLALFASILLISGLLCMSNSSTGMQLAFAAFYILLNALYWAFSALNPTGSWGHWKHKYVCKTIPVVMQTDSKALPPTRSDTEQSYRNESDYTQRPISPIEVDEHIASSPISVTSVDGSRANVMPVPGLINRRQTRVTFSNDVSSSSDSVHELNDMDPNTVRQTAKPTLHSIKTASTTSISTVNGKVNGIARQNTVDAEGLKVRLRRPWGSAVDKFTDWLNDRRLISKRRPKVKDEHAQKEDTFTTALWKAIAITGSTGWLRQTHIAPDNTVWDEWIKDAGMRAAPYLNDPLDNGPKRRVAAYKKNEKGEILLPSWDYQAALTDLFKEQADSHRRPPKPDPLPDVEKWKRSEDRRIINGVVRVWKLVGLSNRMEAKLIRWAKEARERASLRRDLRRGRTLPNFNERPQHVNGIRPSNTAVHDFARQNSAPI